MTKPRDMHRERQTEATTDRDLEVRPEVIADLDVPGDEDIIGGGNGTCQPGSCNAHLTYNQN